MSLTAQFAITMLAGVSTGAIIAFLIMCELMHRISKEHVEAGVMTVNGKAYSVKEMEA